jgi:hypothetical protein
VTTPNLLERLLAFAPDLVLHRTLAQFESAPFALRHRPENAARVTRAIGATSADAFARFKPAVGRNDFLVAALRHLSEIQEHEELLIAMGRRRGTDAAAPSALEGMWRGRGTRGQVGLAPEARDLIDKQVGVVPNAEMIFVHNHPRHDLKSLLAFLVGWKPLPSSRDRDTALAFNVRAALSTVSGVPSAFRFYIVDEGELSEFFLPSVETFVGLFEKAGLVRPGLRPSLGDPP